MGYIELEYNVSDTAGCEAAQADIAANIARWTGMITWGKANFHQKPL